MLAHGDDTRHCDAGRTVELLAEPALDAVPAGEVLGWGVAADVVRERRHGEDLEVRAGCELFTGGTATYRG